MTDRWLILDASPLPVEVNLVRLTDAQAVPCQHRKVLCRQCALALAVRAHAEGVAEERARHTGTVG